MAVHMPNGPGDRLGCLVVGGWLALFAPALYLSTFANLDPSSPVRTLALAATRYLIAAAFIGAGIACATWVVAELVQRRRLLAEGIRVTGRVEGLKERITRGTKSTTVTFAPVVTFKAPDGTSQTFTSSESDSRSPYHVGQEVAVLCRPSPPFEAELEAVTRSVLFAVVGGVLAILAIAAGMLPLILR